MYIVVAGGGMVGGELARRLIEGKNDVVLVDTSAEVCNKLYAETGVVAIHGSATRIEILKEAGLAKADTVVAATGEDASNLVAAMLARSMGVPQIIVRMRNADYEEAYKLAGASAIVRVTDLMINQMLVEIEHPEVRKITTIGGGRANIFMVVVPKDAKVIGRNIGDIAKSPKFPSDCIFVAVYNQEKEAFSIPRGSQVINEGDELFLISTAEKIREVVDFVTAQNAK
jgi:trk system potassium uptake protein TrkA